ncbi:MAG: M13 family metallopeptidase [Acidobacteriota bacterium]
MKDRNRRLSAFLIVLLIASWSFSQSSGFDVSRMDKTADACNDFYQYVNGNWLKTTEIPAAFPSWGGFDILQTRNREVSRDILEAAMKNTKAAKGSDEQLIGDYYAACMDTAAIEKAGAAPLAPYLKEIDAIHDARSLTDVIAGLHRRGVPVLFAFGPYVDQKDSSMTIANAFQGGLSLPNRDYYTNTDEKSKEVREKFVAYAAQMFELLGDTPEQAKAHADTIMKMETRLALASKTPVEMRDPANYYTMLPVADADKSTPNFSWTNYSAKLGTPKFTKMNLAEPDFFKVAGKMIADVPINDWKTYLKWTVINSFAPRLSSKFDDANFNFYGKTLSGTPEQQPRWRRCTRAADGAVGEALGQEFVKRSFTPEAKARMDTLITNLFASYREHISKLDWMSDATREQAYAKLAAISRKIGYPEKLRGYKGLKIDRSSYLANTISADEFSTVRDLRDIGNPPDRTRWGMTTPTVNAYYNPSYNEIVFPAGILQPPFFDGKADDALNYGGIGMVIGHELTHGFDDQGSKYDAAGNLKMWWTDDDRKKFDEKANCVSTQFSGYEVDKDLFLNGKLTLGENLADLGGLAIAYDAFKKSMEGKPRPANIDGFTPEQRFFLGFAQAWSEKARPEYERLNVQSDSHSMPRFRVNGPLSMMPQFAEAFACEVDSKMVDKRQCRVW